MATCAAMTMSNGAAQFRTCEDPAPPGARNGAERGPLLPTRPVNPMLGTEMHRLAVHGGDPTPMDPRPLLRHCTRLAGYGLLATTLSACHLEQVQFGQVILFSTPPAGVCPRLDWEFVVDAQRAFHGILTRDLKPFAKISGTLNPDDSYRIELTRSDNGQTATVTDTITSDVTTMAINGEGAGRGCNGQVYNLRLGLTFQGGRTWGGGGNA